MLRLLTFGEWFFYVGCLGSLWFQLTIGVVVADSCSFLMISRSIVFEVKESFTWIF